MASVFEPLVQPIFYPLELPLLLAMSPFQTVYVAIRIPYACAYIRMLCGKAFRSLNAIGNHRQHLPIVNWTRHLNTALSRIPCYRALEAIHLLEPASTAFHPSHTPAIRHSINFPSALVISVYLSSSWPSRRFFAEAVVLVWVRLSADWEGGRGELAIAWHPIRIPFFSIHFEPLMSIR
jgi:hypothetical protein